MNYCSPSISTDDYQKFEDCEVFIDNGFIKGHDIEGDDRAYRVICSNKK